MQLSGFGFAMAASSPKMPAEEIDELDGADMTLAEEIGESTDFAKAALGTDGEGPAVDVADRLSPPPL